MSKTLWDAFSVKIRFASPEPQRLLNEILHKNIPVWRIEQEKGAVSFRIFPTRKRYFSAFQGSLSPEEVWEETPCGILYVLVLFRRRIGFFAGLLFLILSLFLSTHFLWGIKIHGNVLITDDVIRQQLALYGLAPGKRLSSLDAKQIALRFAIDHEEYVHVGINVVGTCAKVEIREREYVKTEVPTYEGSSNLVAKIYGTVVRYEVLSGKIEVKKGDLVREGQLLINGIRETKNGTFYPVRAAGRVYAETSRSFSVTVPFEECVRVYGGEEKHQRYLELLGLSLKVPPFSKMPTEVDEILEFAEPITVFGYDLPIVIRERIFPVSYEKKAVIKVDRAEKLAYDKYEQFKRDTFAESDEILSENVILSADEAGVTLTAELSAIEDICREAPFRFTEYSQGN